MKPFLKMLIVIPFLLPLLACGGGGGTALEDDEYRNPVLSDMGSTGIAHYDSLYYFVYNENGRVKMVSSKDATKFDLDSSKVLFNMSGQGLVDLWHPQLFRIRGVWYLYVSADDGETDNHRIYVLENKSASPGEGRFTLLGRIVTDKDDNWAIHPYVFEYRGNVYMLWSGWETTRVFAEVQNIYIARLSAPDKIDGERVLISKPEYEWELQWISKDGTSYTRYPVFVNEAPFFFCNEHTDKAYIYYSASGNWTPYMCVGELSADKDADFLSPSSWTKNPSPVFNQNEKEGIYGPQWPYIIDSRDGKRFYLVYSPMTTAGRNYRRNLCVQPFEIRGGHPVFGEAKPYSTVFKKP